MDFKVYLSHRRLERALRRWMVQRKRKAVSFSQVINAVQQEPRAGLKLSGHSYRLHCNGVLCPDLLSCFLSDGRHFCTQLWAIKPLFI